MLPLFLSKIPRKLYEIFVFIGIPAFASRNALLLPLTGHEIGHAIWRLRDIEGPVYTTADQFLVEYIEINRDALIPNPGLFREIDEEQLHSRVMKIVMSQAQEVFCDLFGAYLFKRSFYYAFEQYLFPGFGKRESAYPSFEYRLKYIKRASFEGLKDVDDIEIPGFPQILIRSPSVEVVAADAISERLHDAIGSIVKKILAEAALLEYSMDDEVAVSACLQSGVPPQKVVSSVVILNSIWSVFRDGVSKIDDVECRHKFTDFANNLCMKSLEIVEFLQSGD